MAIYKSTIIDELLKELDHKVLDKGKLDQQALDDYVEVIVEWWNNNGATGDVHQDAMDLLEKLEVVEFSRPEKVN